MAKSQSRHGIQVELSDAQFHEFFLAHLTREASRAGARIALRKIFNYILKVLFLGVPVGSAADRQKPSRSFRNSSPPAFTASSGAGQRRAVEMPYCSVRCAN